MSSHRVADKPLDAIKEAMLLALRGVKHHLGAYGKEPSDPAPLEAMIDAIAQLRGPLQALEHRKAVVLIDELRLLTLGLIKGKFRNCDPALLQGAAAQLSDYLESSLEPGQRRTDSELSRTIETLRQIRQQEAVKTGDAARIVASDTARYGILDALKRLQKSVASDFEGLIDQPKSWIWLRDELRNLRRLVAEQDLARPAWGCDRLERIADALGAGAEAYRSLASGIVGEILATLGHYLEPLDSSRPASASVLDGMEEQLEQLETLLGLPPLPFAPPAAPPANPPKAEAIQEGDLGLAWALEPPAAHPSNPEDDDESATVELSLRPSKSDTAAAASRQDQNGAMPIELRLEPPEPAGDLAFTLSQDALPNEGPDLSPQSDPAVAEASPELAEGAGADRKIFSLDLSGADDPAKAGEAGAVDAGRADASPQVQPDGPAETDGSEIAALESASPAPGEPATAELMALIGVDESDPEFVDIFLEEAREELKVIRENVGLWRIQPDSHELASTLRRAFHTLKGSGRMVGATVIGDFAWEYENLLNQVLNGTRSPSPAICEAVGMAASALAPLVGASALRGGEVEALRPLVARAQALSQADAVEPVTAPPSARFEPASTGPVAPPVEEPRSARIVTQIDPEFFEVFMEEAREELQRIEQQQAVWRQNLGDQQALTTLRRAFHTLKGSGRVVGATEIGDFAWEFENLLNQVLGGSLPASTAVVELVSEAGGALEQLLEQPAGGNVRETMKALVARAQALLQGAQEPAMPAPAPRVPPAPAEPAKAPPAPLKPARTVDIRPAIGAEAALSDPDQELVQVFQYEAAEILDASDLILQRLAAEEDHAALLNDLRRSMHTLKGGSRMSGFMAIGDLAHAAESVLDALGKSEGQASPIILETLQHTLDSLNRMLAEAASSGDDPPAATHLIHDLHRLGEAIATGKPITELPASVTAPEPATERSAVKRPAPLPEPAAVQTITELDQELIQVFKTEASEILDSSDAILLRLRETPSSVELLNDLRREMHTLKGSSRMAGYMTVGELAHAAESILDGLGKGTLQGSARVMDLIQRSLDRLHQMLAGVLGGEQPPAQRELIEELQGVIGVKLGEPRSRSLLPAVTATLTAAAAATAAARPAERAMVPSATSADSIRVSAALLTTLVNQMGESSIFRARIDQGVGAISFNLNELEQTIIRLRRQVTHLATQSEARIQSRQDRGAKAHEVEFDPLELDRFTELQQVSRSLMEIADDLGNIGNAMGEHAREVTTLLDQQGKVNKEIQQGLMRTGMVRFGSIVPRLRRVVRQSAQELGKRAELLVGGEEAEVDRNVLENMVAPLEHMLRNSLAHGIETPERRRQDNKPEIGTITLTLRREGAELVLELGDDGSGLNFEAIRTKGEEKGLLKPGESVTQEELIALLLRPGFSTATSVTQISGRGVGMDVVNEAIRAMRGALLIETEPGQGTRFIIRLPFSLSVTQALLVRAGESIFAIPLLSIELVTRLQENEFKAYLAGEPLQHRYSERNYPIHNLGLLIGGEQIQSFDEVADRRPPTLLFRSAEASAALQVEAVLGNREVIVKPVGPQFNGVPGISGATVLGDGRVVVVLELAALVRNIGSHRQRQAETQALRLARQETRPDKLSVMVIDDSITMRKVTARILERHNIEVITAKDGLDAVAMLQTQVPDLAILDIEMPRMDGFEVVAHVRNQPTLRAMPIIMVTSRSGDKHRERAMKLGATDYLTKPYQEEQLMQSIRRILGDRALELIT
ncbi:MAG: Hpt domain-containing protein [Candidatus Competibacteraceae bacterium]|nr:Hpt domain-containing protein [Candidatus Competibacteraceae bacterium]